METKKIATGGLVRRQGDEGKPLFAVSKDGGICHIGFTSSGWKQYEVPADTVAVAFPLWGNRDGYICIHEPADDMPERTVVSTWEHRSEFAHAVAEALGIAPDSDAVRELVKRVGRFVR